MGITIGDFEAFITTMSASPGPAKFSAAWSVYKKPVTDSSPRLARGSSMDFATPGEARAAAQADAVAVVRRLEAGEEIAVDEDE